MRPSLRKALYISAGIIIIILAALTAASFYMLRFSLAPDPNRRDTDSTYNILYSRFPDMKPWMDSIRAGGHLRDTFVVSPAGVRQFNPDSYGN